MPKRSAEEKMEYYSSKIRKLQEQNYKRRRRIVLSDSSDSEETSDHERLNNEITTATTIENEINDDVEMPPAQSNEVQTPPLDDTPVIDAELLTALGEATDDVPIYGENIHPDLAQRWTPILRKGITKENKDKLLKEYTIPENCKLLRAPSLNAEIAAAITDIARARDRKIELSQQQLGVGIAATNLFALSILLTTEDKQSKIQAIKIISDGCRILTDLHYSESLSRIKLVTPGLDRMFLNVIQEVERDETLFGSKLSQKIKASKAIEKQGLQIKKGTVATVAGSNTPQSIAPTHSRYQGNWTRPSRFQPASRRGRGGPQRNAPAPRRPPAPGPAHTQSRAGYNKPRAPARH